MEKLKINRGFWRWFGFSIITLNIYNLYLIHAQAKETNIACKDDGKNTTSLFLFIIFSVLTLGIYAIVWNAKLIGRRCAYLAQNCKSQGLQVSTYLLTVFLFGWLTLGVMYIVVFCKCLYQQNDVNRTYNEINNN